MQSSLSTIASLHYQAGLMLMRGTDGFSFLVLCSRRPVCAQACQRVAVLRLHARQEGSNEYVLTLGSCVCSYVQVWYCRPMQRGSVSAPVTSLRVRGHAAIALKILINLTPHYFHAAALQFEVASQWNSRFVACARCIVYFSFGVRDWRQLPLTIREDSAEGRR